MLARIFFFLIGFGLTIIGCVFIILYLNIMTIGYSFSEYVNFIIRRLEFYYAIIGFLILNLSIFIKGGTKGGLYFRYYN
ncbi:MAG: hypothetical protein PHY26_04115 [Bacilli bacterium]|jgi:hypothetical protein|nr:hypothetical protein [Bacilli bacterium]